jgi:hypothetical protein
MKTRGCREKRTYHRHNEDKFAAVKAAREQGLSFDQINAKTGVSRTTAWNWSRMQQYRAPGAKPLMAAGDERKFVQSLQRREAQNHPVTAKHAGKRAAQTLAARKLQFKNYLPSASWFRNAFKRQHAKLRPRKTERLKKQLTMQDVRNLQECNAKLGALFAKHDFPDFAVIGLDEVMMHIAPDEKVLSEAPRDQRVRAPEPQWSGHVTTVGCIGADGSRYPPMYIFAGKRAPPQLAEGGGLCAIGATGAFVCSPF